ncbi:MAG: winged helix-turn-helix domain-containing protein [Chloroflexota bacterium]|nr:winged helix-turn-helix domain-containing protein [Chloroflexota bacterium]
MKKKEVIPTMKALVESVDAIIQGLNEKGAQLFKQGKYDQARAMLAKVESILGFRGKVLCLEDEWKILDVPILKKSSKPKVKKASATMTKPLPRGLRTNPGSFRYPILEALDRLGGSGNIREVFRIVEEILSGQLNKYDYQALPSDPNSIRWKKTVSWERYNMVKEGLLVSDSQRGIWEITDTGRESLRHARETIDLQHKLFSGKSSS